MLLRDLYGTREKRWVYVWACSCKRMGWGERERERERESAGDKRKKRSKHTIILNPHRSTSAILTNLIIAIRENAGLETIIKDRIMIIFLIAPVAVTAAMAQIIFEGDVGGRGDRLLLDGGGDVAVGTVAVLVVDALGLAGVDVGVIPKGKGGVRGDGVVGVVFIANGGEAFVIVFAGAVVEGEDLEGG